MLQRAHKSLLPNYRYFDDKRYFAPARSRDTVDVPRGAGTVRLGVSICEDMWDEFYAVKPLPELAAKGADLLVNINASPFYPGKRQERDALIRRHIARLGKPFVYVNTSGAADNGKNIIPFDGESLVYAADGRLLAMGRQFAEELLIVDLDREASSLALPPSAREREIYDALVMALRDYMRKTGFTRAVVAVSGGIDSALALAIAVDALGPDNVSAFNMPSQFNTETTRGIAAQLAQALGVHYGIIPIQDIADHIQRAFEDHAHPIARGFTRENLQARIRGILMMAESNDTGALLISCGNETEIALGYATLYGDMCGGISLIGDLSKIDVYRLARHVNERHGAQSHPGGRVHDRPVRRARGQSVRPVRLRRRRAARRRDGRASAQPGGAPGALRAPRARSRTASCPTPTAGPSTTSTRPRRSRPCSTTPPGDCAVRYTSAFRVRPSSPSRSARSASICGRRSSMDGRGERRRSGDEG